MTQNKTTFYLYKNKVQLITTKIILKLIKSSTINYLLQKLLVQLTEVHIHGLNLSKYTKNNFEHFIFIRIYTTIISSKKF